MADIKYKKGELLLAENVSIENQGSVNMGSFQNIIALKQNILIIDFNGVEYLCEKKDNLGDLGCYGGISINGPDFSIYPFAIGNGCSDPNGENITSLNIYVENSGTHAVKIYTAIEDTDSTPLSPTDFIIDHIMSTPANTNWNVLSTLLGAGDWSKLKAYVEKTPHNMNRKVLEALLGSSSGGGAVVGTAVVGRDTVG